MSHFPKKTKKIKKNDIFPPPHARGLRERSGSVFFCLGALRERPGSAVLLEGARSLKTLPKGSVQGARSQERSLNAPLRSAIRERVRGGGGRSPAA
jgi:hypothetical protein